MVATVIVSQDFVALRLHTYHLASSYELCPWLELRNGHLEARNRKREEIAIAHYALP